MTNAPRIERIEPVLLRAPLERPILGPFGRLDARPNLLVRATLDNGGEGVGEIWANFPPWGCEERIAIVRHVIAPLLQGEPLDDPRRLCALMHARLRLLANQWGAPGPVHQAIAGVDIALWDAQARELGKPLCDLLRGSPAPRRVAVYASGVAPPHLPAIFERARRNGHRRFKIRLSFGLETDRAALREGRRLAGEDPLMADANQTFDAAHFAALRDDLLAARLEWLEEPFPVDDVAAYRDWPRDLGLPLAHGENRQGAAAFDAIVADGAAVVQPDLTKTLGLSEGLEVGRRVVAAGRKLCFHMFGGGIGLYASAHLTAAIEGSHWLEMDANRNPLIEEALDRPPQIEDGALLLGDGPGLGVALAPEALRRWAA